MLRQRNHLWAALAAALAVSSCGSGQSEDPRSRFQQRSQGLPAVEAVEVRYGSFPLEERLAGSARAGNQTDIYPEAAGTIEAVYVNDGDRVAAGDPLVQLRARDFQERVRQAESGLQVADARVRQTEANVARMRANLERVSSIVERQLGTRAELDAAVADAASAEADLDLMSAQRDQAASLLQEREAELADTLVRAPIDGVVGGRNAEVGQQANTSAPLFVIGDVTNMQVEITLTQRMLGYIETGTAVNIYSDTSPEDIIQAEVSRISPYLHPITHTTRAEILVAEHNGLLRPGMFVTVDVLHGQSEQAPLVPNSALYRHPRDGREGVFVTSLEEALRDPEGSSGYSSLDDAPSLEDPVGPVAVRFAPVDVVARGRMSSGVSGIEAGDWVVTLGHHLLVNSNDGQAIVQPTPWEHILDLQRMQSRDLLDVISEKQRQNEARQ